MLGVWVFAGGGKGTFLSLPQLKPKPQARELARRLVNRLSHAFPKTQRLKARELFLFFRTVVPRGGEGRGEGGGWLYIF